MTVRLLLSIGFIASAFAGDFPREYLSEIEDAHKTSAWYSHNAFRTSFELTNAGGEKRFAGVMLMRPHAGITRFDLDNGVSFGFDGKTGWISPADADFEKPRFHALTWPYFVAAPHKLDDPGARLEDMGKIELRGRKYDGARLSFESGTGDAPDDWYVLYRNPETRRLEAMGYIVTYGGRSAAEAEKETHAITYEDFKDVSGIPVPMTWKFWNWTLEEGLGEHLMTARLTNPEFVEREDRDLAKPPAARPIELPE